MKKNFTLFAITAFLSVSNTQAQTCANIYLRTGSSFTYSCELPEKNEVVQTVESVTYAKNMFNYYFNTTAKGKTTKAHTMCSNGTHIIAPSEDYVTASRVDASKKPITAVSIGGFNKLPLKLKAGDLIGSYQDVSVTFSGTADFKGLVKHSDADNNDDVWTVAALQTNSTALLSFTVTKYINREVMGREDYDLDGVTYEAFKIYSEAWTRTVTNTDASSLGRTIETVLTQKVVDKTTHQLTAPSPEGYEVKSSYQWFVPLLGTFAKTETYDAKGNLIEKTTLKGVK